MQRETVGSASADSAELGGEREACFSQKSLTLALGKTTICRRISNDRKALVRRKFEIELKIEYSWHQSETK